MKRLTLLAALAALAATLVAVAISSGSSHREAPGSMLDPSGDWTDVYFFTPADDQDKAVVVANVIPFEDPAGGPFFYTLDPRARYYLNFDNDGDGRPDIRYRFSVSDIVDTETRLALGQKGQVTSPTDPDLTLRQTYDVVREEFDDHGNRRSANTVASDVPVAPSNFGPKTMPDYASIASQAERSLPDGGRVFVGQRDDPFFIDLGGVFDLINFRAGTGTGNQGGGKDDVAGYAVHSFVLKLPEEQLTRDRQQATGPDDRQGVVGVWASTERRRLQVADGRDRGAVGPWVQVNRLGNPLINELFIPVSRKDEFNRSQPKDDAENFGQFALEPEIVKALNGLFNLGCPETNRTDIVQALFTGIPGLTRIATDAVPADTLKLNFGVPATTPGQENRFGVIGGDNAGLPNGRRLLDDTVDIYERVACGFLVPPDQGGKQLPLGDGVDENDKPFLSSFPYAALPTSGFDSQIKRQLPAHAPTPGSPPLVP
jgi:Domain of unknown function (DUF4331)